jgi:hypothetical protein
VAGSSEHSNETLGSTKRREILEPTEGLLASQEILSSMQSVLTVLHTALCFRRRVASKEDLWGRKLIRSIKKIHQQLNDTMENFKKQLLNDMYEEVSRDVSKRH